MGRLPASAHRRVTRAQWRAYYVQEYNRHQREDCAVLAMWYELLILAFGDS